MSEQGSKSAKEYLELFVNGRHPAQIARERMRTMRLEDESLESRVSRIESIIGFMTGDGSLSGQIWKMNWGYIIWGNDGCQFVQNENVQDCPEIGGATWLGNSILKICGRAMERRSNGEVAVTELSLLQLKRDTGSELTPGDAVGGLGGIFRGDFNNGGGSTDGAMKFSFEVGAKGYALGVPRIGGGTTSSPSGRVSVVSAPGGQTQLHVQGDRPVMVFYDTTDPDNPGQPTDDNTKWQVIWHADEKGLWSNPDYIRRW